MKLKVQALTADAFRLFGDVIAAPAHEPTAQPEGMAYWAGVAELPELGTAYSVGYATQEVRPFVQTMAERHLRTPELLMPVGGDMAVVAGPAEHLDEPERLPAPELFAAFRVPEGQGVIFRAGVWHWAPFAVDRTITLLVVYAAGTAEEDAVVVELPPEMIIELAS
jgi:ureidoglycolate lyase